MDVSGETVNMASGEEAQHLTQEEEEEEELESESEEEDEEVESEEEVEKELELELANMTVEGKIRISLVGKVQCVSVFSCSVSSEM